MGIKQQTVVVTGESEMRTQLPRPSDVVSRLRAMAAQAYFAFIKLPLIFLLIVFGFIFDFIIQLPFCLRVARDGRRRVKGRQRCALEKRVL
jgi:hypothetical protein